MYIVIQGFPFSFRIVFIENEYNSKTKGITQGHLKIFPTNLWTDYAKPISYEIVYFCLCDYTQI